MSMKGFYQGKATIKKQVTEPNELGEPIVTGYEEVGKADFRISSKQSQYVRTEAGFEKQNLWEALVPAKTKVEQGQYISFKGEDYHVIGVDDDGADVFLKLTLE